MIKNTQTSWVILPTKWGWTDQINMKPLSSGEAVGHAQGIRLKHGVLNHNVQTTYYFTHVIRWSRKVSVVFLFNLSGFHRAVNVQRTKIPTGLLSYSSVTLGCGLLCVHSGTRPYADMWCVFVCVDANVLHRSQTVIEPFTVSLFYILSGVSVYVCARVSERDDVYMIHKQVYVQ